MSHHNEVLWCEYPKKASLIVLCLTRCNQFTPTKFLKIDNLMLNNSSETTSPSNLLLKSIAPRWLILNLFTSINLHVRALQGQTLVTNIRTGRQSETLALFFVYCNKKKQILSASNLVKILSAKFPGFPHSLYCAVKTWFCIIKGWPCVLFVHYMPISNNWPNIIDGYIRWNCLCQMSLLLKRFATQSDFTRGRSVALKHGCPQQAPRTLLNASKDAIEFWHFCHKSGEVWP